MPSCVLGNSGLDLAGLEQARFWQRSAWVGVAKVIA
jgi:hypothetical protein